MSNAPVEEETFSQEETEARAAAALKRMLATPKEPRKAKGRNRNASRQA